MSDDYSPSSKQILMSDKYILIGQTPVPCEDDLEYAKWHTLNARGCCVVGLTKILGICCVSTMFLGIDHNFSGLSDRPILYESMAFWIGDGGEEQARCSTWAQAERMHARMVAEVWRPGAVLDYVLRMLRKSVGLAKEDWQERWREFRGVKLSADADIAEKIKRLNQRIMERDDEEIFG